MKNISDSFRAVACGTLLLACAGALPTEAASYQVLKSFGDPTQSACNSQSGLIRATDGMLYGTSEYGGEFNLGTVFRLREDGTDMKVIHSFSTNVVAGQRPRGGVIQGADGLLYGTTALGGLTNRGTIFKIACDGSAFTQLYSFASSASGDGGTPSFALTQGPDGMLYGTTPNTLPVRGTAFRIATNGTGYAQLHRFNTTSGEGYSPVGQLVVGTNGYLYGVTASGGANNRGTVFKMSLDGSDYSRHYNFTGGTNGQSPSGLLLGLDGMFYGVTTQGGVSNVGAIYRLSFDGSTYTRLYDFLGTKAGDGAVPRADLVQTADGLLYGTASLGGLSNYGCVFVINTNGVGYRRLHDFAATDPADGRTPQTPLLVGSDGALYGIASSGGNSAKNGAVFRLQTDGSGYRKLWTFSRYGGDGVAPWGTLIQARDGLFYGSCTWGGKQEGGTLFKFDPATAEHSVIYDFPMQADGNAPTPGTLIQGHDGQLYGAASYGGSNSLGCVFRVATDGQSFTVLHEFNDTSEATNGYSPYGSLLQATNGLLYGVANAGGDGGYGVIFQMATNGTGYTVLHHFFNTTNFLDGGQPGEGLIQGTDGFLYGTTANGGDNWKGTIYRLAPDGSGYAIIHHFDNTNGYYPASALLPARDGLLYGVTYYGGTAYGGTVFRVATDGSAFTVLHHFASPDEAGRDGASPYGALVQAADGTLFGVTTQAGAAWYGTVFSLRPETASYATLHHFTGAPADGASSYGLLLVNGDQLYGLSSGGGLMDQGVLFRLTHGRTTATTLASSANPLPHRQTLDLTATVSSLQGIPPGTVTLWSGVTNLGSATLSAAGQVVFHFTNFPAGNSALMAEYNGDSLFDSSLSPVLVQSLTNSPPVVQGEWFSLTLAPINYSLVISGTQLLTNDYDLDGDALTLASVDSYSAVGFPMRYTNGLITYTVPQAEAAGILGQSGDDEFNYEVRDSYGGATRGTVTVHVEAPMSLAAAQLGSTVGVGKFTLSIAGLPSLAYRIERSVDLTNWTALATVPMPASGLTIYDDTAPPPDAAFYRVIYAP